MANQLDRKTHIHKIDSYTHTRPLRAFGGSGTKLRNETPCQGLWGR